MWLNVQFYDSAGALINERGAYNPDSAELSTTDTKVYEGKLGLDADAAAATGLPEGESFHFVLNNTWIKDNRIPPRGFTNAAFTAVQAGPVGYSYADGQYWDDTVFGIPRDACRVDVTLYYQTTTKEYIEFLRDANHTNSAGIDAYNLWVQFGKSEPVAMDNLTLVLTLPADLNGDDIVDLSDLAQLLSAFGDSAGGDVNGDGWTDISDLALLLAYFGSSCD
jgi:hypothetical protein